MGCHLSGSVCQRETSKPRKCDAAQPRPTIKDKGEWAFLSRFDDPNILSVALHAYAKGKMSDLDFRDFLCTYLPLPLRNLPDLYFYGPEKRIDAWIQSRLCGKSYEEICLVCLDELMKPPASSYEPLRYDRGIPLRWFNKIGDADLDQWLAEETPEALEFRNKELKKGYDPAICFYTFVTHLHRGMIDEGIKAVFSNESDRRACRQLIEAVWDDNSPIYLSPTKGWEDRLRDWYWENRDSLVYSFEKHRFVVRQDSMEEP